MLDTILSIIAHIVANSGDKLQITVLNLLSAQATNPKVKKEITDLITQVSNKVK